MSPTPHRGRVVGIPETVARRVRSLHAWKIVVDPAIQLAPHISPQEDRVTDNNKTRTAPASAVEPLLTSASAAADNNNSAHNSMARRDCHRHQQ